MRKWYPYAVIALAIVASIVAVSRMPDTVPIHFNLRGEADGWGSRYVVGAVMPPMLVFIWLTLRGIPKLDPNRERFARFQESYDLMVNATLTLMLVVHFVMLGSALGMPVVSGTRVILIGVGLLLIVIGNLIPKAPRNWVVGVRTPWTQSNDRVWERSQRAGGYAMTGAGLLVIAGAFLPEPFNFVMMLTSTLLAAGVAVGYSYYISKDEGGASA